MVLICTDTFTKLVPTSEAEHMQGHFASISITPKEQPTDSHTPVAAAIAKAADVAPKQQKIVSYAMSLLGTPYVYAGISKAGFDCSGFITHVFDNYGIDLPHSSAMQANEGTWVAKQEARTGDLVIFTGTDLSKREPGHVGIVISAPGDTIEFVHSSSNGGVKVSKVEGTRYDKRFLEIRRVL